MRPATTLASLTAGPATETLRADARCPLASASRLACLLVLRLHQQIGTADPELAVQAALTIERDVAGVDLNCGCPKPFSTHNGAGAGLLSTPDLLCSILTSLVAAVSVPVSCKIRLLPDQADTLALVDRICQTGIRNLTVHARTKSMRSTERALMERLRDIVVVATKHGIPVAANGDVGGVWDFARIKEITGASRPPPSPACERVSED